MHIPPKNFVRIRHYGLLSNHNKRNLIPICRNQIGCREFLRRFKNNDNKGLRAPFLIFCHPHKVPFQILLFQVGKTNAFTPDPFYILKIINTDI